jgi:hypothetical protein
MRDLGAWSRVRFYGSIVRLLGIITRKRAED